MPKPKTTPRAGIAALLKARRMGLGFSAEFVADTCGIGLRTVWRCESRGHLPQTKAARKAYLACLRLTDDLKLIPAPPTK